MAAPDQEAWLPEVLRPSFERNDARGLFWELFNDGTWRSVVHGVMEPQAVMGQHYHHVTDVLFFLLTGSAEVVFEDPHTGRRGMRRLGEREGLLLKRGIAHAIHFTARSMFLLLKSEPYRPDDPDTVPYHVR